MLYDPRNSSTYQSRTKKNCLGCRTLQNEKEGRHEKRWFAFPPFHSISLATLLYMPSLGSLHHLCLLWAIFNVVPSLEDHHIANTTAIRTGEYWKLQLIAFDEFDVLKPVSYPMKLPRIYPSLYPVGAPNTPTVSFNPSPILISRKSKCHICHDQEATSKYHIHPFHPTHHSLAVQCPLSMVIAWNLRQGLE